MKGKAVYLAMYNTTMVKIIPYKQFRGSWENIRELPLQTYCFTYLFTRQKKQIEEINGGNSHENAFLETGVSEQLTKFQKINVEKFTFSSTEAWKSATSLQTNSFMRDFPRILIRFLSTTIFENCKNTAILQNILLDCF